MIIIKFPLVISMIMALSQSAVGKQSTYNLSCQPSAESLRLFPIFQEQKFAEITSELEKQLRQDDNTEADLKKMKIDMIRYLGLLDIDVTPDQNEDTLQSTPIEGILFLSGKSIEWSTKKIRVDFPLGKIMRSFRIDRKSLTYSVTWGNFLNDNPLDYARLEGSCQLRDFSK